MRFSKSQQLFFLLFKTAQGTFNLNYKQNKEFCST